MQQGNLPAPLRQFVGEVSALLEAGYDESRLLPGVGESMRLLVANDDWLDADFAKPHPRHYQQYLLYLDPDDRFCVVSFVWGPGQQTPIHDHTVWGVIGMLRGAELTQRYEITNDGTPHAIDAELALMPGGVEFVSPTIGDVHEVRNALDDQVSISIHAYGADIGRVRRRVFVPGGGEPRVFVSGYSNAEP